jgi:hypothetical protein
MKLKKLQPLIKRQEPKKTIELDDAYKTVKLTKLTKPIKSGEVEEVEAAIKRQKPKKRNKRANEVQEVQDAYKKARDMKLVSKLIVVRGSTR